MTWRIHISSHAIRDLQILLTAPPTLAVWTQSDRVECYDLSSGAAQGYRRLAALPSDDDYLGEDWRSFFACLADAGGTVHLPRVNMRQTVIYNSADGSIRLIETARKWLHLLTDNEVHTLDVVGNPAALCMRRSNGRVLMLDATGRFSIYRRHRRIATSETPLRPGQVAGNAQVCAGHSDGTFATDGQQIVSLDDNGRLLARLDVHYRLGQIACSPSGNMLVTSDNEAGLIRVYQGSDLRHSHQRYAQDLIMEARQLQLLADLPPVSVAISALALGENGEIAFAMAGMVCVTHISHLTELP